MIAHTFKVLWLLSDRFCLLPDCVGRFLIALIAFLLLSDCSVRVMIALVALVAVCRLIALVAL